MPGLIVTALPQRVAQGRQMSFGHGEADEQRLHAVDDRQRRIVVLDRRARKNQAGADNAVDRRANGCIGELQAGEIGRRLAGALVGDGRAFAGPHVIDFLVGNELPFLELGVARRVRTRLGDQRRVAGDGGVRLLTRAAKSAGSSRSRTSPRLTC